MNLYHIEQGIRNGYDTYSDAVVAAESEEAAQRTYPGEDGYWSDREQQWQSDYTDCDGGKYTLRLKGEWADNPSQVEVTLIGTSIDDETGVICASYHAG